MSTKKRPKPTFSTAHRLSNAERCGPYGGKYGRPADVMQPEANRMVDAPWRVFDTTSIDEIIWRVYVEYGARGVK